MTPTNENETNLTEFLLARGAEDEAVARAAEGGALWEQSRDPAVITGLTPFDGGVRASAQSVAIAAHIARHDPARVLAECEAKRELVTNLARVCEDGRCWQCGSANVLDLRDAVLLTLASVYSTHPDYRAEWRP